MKPLLIALYSLLLIKPPTRQKEKDSSPQPPAFVLNSATQQSWSGGICCRRGTNYAINFTIQNVTPGTTTLDSLWIGHDYYCLHCALGANVGKSQTDTTTTYSINCATVYDDVLFMDMLYQNEKPVVKPQPPAHQGEACIILHVKKRKYVFEINAFTHLESLAYP